jgi:hypothetical protein
VSESIGEIIHLITPIRPTDDRFPSKPLKPRFSYLNTGVRIRFLLYKLGHQ